MVEYALILVLIAIVVIVILQVVGKQVNNVFSNISNAWPRSFYKQPGQSRGAGHRVGSSFYCV